MSTTVWESSIQGVQTNFSASISRDRSVAVFAVSQAKGIGSVFHASSDESQCLLGNQTDNLESAFALALVKHFGLEKVILNVALRAISTQIIKELLAEVFQQIPV